MSSSVLPRASYYRAADPTRRLLPLLGILVVAIIAYMADDWIVLPGFAVLAIGWKYLAREEGSPVIAAAFTYQWAQVMIAILYFAFTGRRIVEMDRSYYRPMVLIGLAAIAAMFAGFFLTARLPKRIVNSARRPNLSPTLSQLVILYVTAVASSGVLEQLAWSLPFLTQALLVLSLIRYVFLYVLVGRLTKPRMQIGWLLLILLSEVVLGFSGYFANFREPLFVIGVAVLGAMDKRRIANWLLIGVVGLVGIGAAIAWTAVKPVIRKNFMAEASTTQRVGIAMGLIRPTLLGSTAGFKYQADRLVSRMWQVYFPALALVRVPSVVPHENGALLWAAIENLLTPRLFFPDKPELQSDSDKVRKYSGIWVAGRETGTSYAFGYTGESYVDFGLPWMFVPIFLYGAGMGLVHRRLRRAIRHPEVRGAVIVVLFWMSMYLFEVSWAIMLGFTITRIIVLGAGAIIVDRLLLPRRRPVARAIAVRA